jgi:hypothetical protein
MIESCRSCMHLFNDAWISEAAGDIIFTERNPSGLGEARFTSKHPSIVIKADKNAPLIWALAQRKCADGAFYSFDEAGAHLHLVELKGKVSLATWAHTVQQFEGMFLTSLAIGRLLDIQKPISVTCYLAAKEDRIASASQTAPALIKAPVGKSRTFGEREAWDKEQVPLPLSFKAALVKGWQDTGGIAAFGDV